MDLGFILGRKSFLSFNGEAGFTYFPIVPLDSVSLFSIGAGAGLRLKPENRLNFEGDMAVGYYYGIINDENSNGVGNFYARGGAGLTLLH